MKFKREITLIFLFSFTIFLVISAVSAESNFTNFNNQNVKDINNIDVNTTYSLSKSAIDYSSNEVSLNSGNEHVELSNLTTKSESISLNKSNIKSESLTSSSDYMTYEELSSYFYNTGWQSYYSLDKDVKYTDNDFYPYNQIDWNVTIDGNGHTIDGNNQANIFTFGCYEAVKIDKVNIIIKNFNFINAKGGAMQIGLDTTVTFINCKFENNYGTDYGGAINIDNHNVYSTKIYKPKVNIQNCTFINNRANLFGGAIYNTGTLNIISSIFNNNYADARGGAIYNFNNSAMGIESSTFTGNTAHMEGAAIDNVYNYNIGSSINNCEFYYNEGYYNDYTETINNVAGLMVISNSKINNNNAGGVYNYANGYGNSKLILKNNEIINNKAQGVMNGNTYRDYSITNIEQCIITDNNGGIYNNQGPNANLADRNVVNAHYNVIFNNGVDISNDMTLSKTSKVYAQYNWWGSNKGASSLSGSNINTQYPVVMSLSPNAYSTITSKNSIITAYLNHYLSSNNLITLNKSIPTRVAYFETNNGEGKFSSNNLNLLDSATVSYTAGNNPTTISATVDNQVLELYINPLKSINTSSSLKIDLNTIYVGNTTNLIDTIKTNEYNNVNNGTVDYYANNSFIGSSNVKNGTSNYSWIPTKSGTYNIESKYRGNDYYNPSTNSITIIVYSLIPINISSTKLSSDTFIETFGEGKNFTVNLTDENGKTLIGQHISIKLFRINGQFKTYWATTDINGNAMLQINLSPGFYKAEVNYNGNNQYNASAINSTITVNSASENRTSVILTTEKFNQPFGAGANFTGKLKDFNGNVIIGQHIAINLTRISNGLSKVYWVTTDTDGAFQLQINLGLGEYTAQCSYGGTNTYQPNSDSNTISVFSDSDSGNSGSSGGSSPSGGSISGITGT